MNNFIRIIGSIDSLVYGGEVALSHATFKSESDWSVGLVRGTSLTYDVTYQGDGLCYVKNGEIANPQWFSEMNLLINRLHADILLTPKA